MSKAKPADWGKNIDLVPFIPGVGCIVLGLGLQLQRAEVRLIWNATSTLQSFAIRCELATQSILSRLRTTRGPAPEFRDKFWLLYRGQKQAVEFGHYDFDSCGDFFQGNAIGGTWNNQKRVFTDDGVEDEES